MTDNHTFRKKFIKATCFFLLFLSILWSILGFLIPQWSIKLTEYQFTSDKVTEPIRIVELSDLHCADLGDKLPTMVAEQNPDLILFVGDIVDMGKEDISVALSTLQSLSDIAPLYVSLGNHDWEYRSNNDVDIVAAFEEAGATVLEASYMDITVKGQAVRIGGIYGYCLPDNVVEAREKDSNLLNEFQATDDLTLFMGHMPVCWIINGSLEYWDVDFVFSGHSHGGHVVLPFVGGLYAPDQGWFPGECSGHFEAEGKHLIVTTGLGGTTPVPRFWNRPEIVVIDILPG